MYEEMTARRAGAGAVVDLRSDTVTHPTAEMRAAMAAAAVGDDVYGEDPTVNRLEAEAAERLGKAAAVFVPTCTQANLAAMLAHCGRGEEVISGERYHVIRYEAAGASVLGGVSLRPLPIAEDGALEPDAIADAVQPDDSHHPVSRLLALENTHYGQVVPLARLEQGVAAARAAGLSTHLDGARFFNAVVALGVAPERLAAPFDTVSVCLSKGLGAPAGALVCGAAAAVDRARRWRKMLGGGMRQAGVLAAAGLYALERHVERLAEDHARAARLAAALGSVDGLEVAARPALTNMVFVRPADPARAPTLRRALAEAGVLTGAPAPWMRLVTHLDIDDAGVDRAAEAFAAALRKP